MLILVRKEFDFPSANGAANIYACIWYDDERPKNGLKGIIQLAHGMSEHILRYEPYAVYLAKNGYIVCGNDHIGHGRSVSVAEELGYFGEGEGGLEFAVEDMLFVTEFVRKRFGRLPVALIGHSMGSFLARRYVDKLSFRLSGAAFLGTAGLPQAVLKPLAALSRADVKKHGPMWRGGDIFQSAFGGLNIKCMPSRTGFDWICTDNAVVDKFMADERCGFMFTCGGYRDLFLLMLEIGEEEWGSSVASDFPMLILSGRDDPIGEFGHGALRFYNFLKTKGFNRTELKIFDGMRHELLNEAGRRSVYRTVDRWLYTVM